MPNFLRALSLALFSTLYLADLIRQMAVSRNDMLAIPTFALLGHSSLLRSLLSLCATLNFTGNANFLSKTFPATFSKLAQPFTLLLK